MRTSNNSTKAPVFLNENGNMVLNAIDYWHEKQPEKHAIIFGSTSLSYKKLANSILNIKSALQKGGVKPGDVIAVSISRSLELVPILLSIWSLRATYVPIDPQYPLKWKNFILDNSDVDFFINEGEEAGENLNFMGKIILTKNLFNMEKLEVSKLSNNSHEDSDLAYIIYTSGSTGRPKGVAIAHKSVENFLIAMSTRPGMNIDDHLLAVTTFSFDIHILEFFLPLLVGASVFIASKEESRSQEGLRKLIDENSISIMQATPATWRLLLGEGWESIRKLKLLVGGEKLPEDLLPLMHESAYEVWNMYGPTEATVWCSCQLIKKEDKVIYIGKPILNTEMLVVDSQMKKVKDGNAGELLIGGEGLAIGYHNSKALTDERFIFYPELSDSRLYKSGDLVVPYEGNFEFVGRIDEQIKIMGFRIESRQVEIVLEEYHGVAQAVLVVCQKEVGDQRMVVFYSGEKQYSSLLRKYCLSKLPAYMAPNYFYFLDEFPMTKNLKIDKKRLVKIADNKIFKQNGNDINHLKSKLLDDLELSLLHDWEKVLGQQGLELDDNFFERGGNSLLALVLVDAMYKHTGIHFEQSSLFKFPTIRSLIDSLGAKANEAASVIKLNHCCSGDPVFCLCGVQLYKILAQMFEQSNPVYGIFAKEEISYINKSSDDEKKYLSLPALAKVYVDAIIRQGAFKSLQLVGLSFGGLLALEVSKQLKNKGIIVSSIILLDTYLPDVAYRSPTKLLSDSLARINRDGIKSFLNELLRRGVKKSKTSKIRTIITGKVRDDAYDHMSHFFSPRGETYYEDVLLIKALQTDFGFGKRAPWDYGLSHIVKGRITIKEVHSGHIEILQGEEVKNVYEFISEYNESVGA